MRNFLGSIVIVLVACLLATGVAMAQVSSHQKISDTQGGFTGTLESGDLFGSHISNLGDLDGDGVVDLVVGAIRDDDGPGTNRGAVWILFLDTDGSVQSHQKISDTEGGFGGTLVDGDNFGVWTANLGDLNGDGVQDIAVGAYLDDDGPGTDRGAVWILFLDTDGTVKSEQKISDTQGGFGGTLTDQDRFGAAVANLGDLDNDGVQDIAVTANGDGDGGNLRGATWILFLNTNGTVKSYQKISDTQGGFTGTLDDGDNFGTAATGLGDLDGDGVEDLAVGAAHDDDGGLGHGAVWVLFLNTNGTVKSHQKISDTEGGFSGTLGHDLFGHALASPGDLDGDGVQDLLVGAQWDDSNGTNSGAMWILFLKDDGTVLGNNKITENTGGFTGDLETNDQFGLGVASLGDLDGDGTHDLVAGAIADDDGAADAGAVWVLFGAGATTEPSLADPATGSTIVACIDIDVSGEGPLGSYGATLTWDETVLDYVSYSGGDSPFDIPVVNEDDVLTGSLAFSDADTTGASGEVHVLCVTFDVIGAAGTSSTLDLDLTSMFEAVTFDDLLPWPVADATVDVVLECTVGDVNGDGSINSGDALIILSDEIGLTIPATPAERIAARCGDADGDGDTDSADANVVLSFEVGLDVSGNPINGPNVTADDCSACTGGGGGGDATARAPRTSGSSRDLPVLAEVVGSTWGVRAKQPFEALIVVDTTSAGRPLGSYTARLEWDPNAVEFVGTLGGSTLGFHSPMMNPNQVSRGTLRFTDANPYGVNGRVELLRVQFRALRALKNPARALKLSFSSMASTGPAFEELAPRFEPRPLARHPERGEAPQRWRP